MSIGNGTPSGYARFDADGRLVDSSPGFLPTGADSAGAGAIASCFVERVIGVDGDAARTAVATWLSGRPGDIVGHDGNRVLLSSCPTGDGGRMLMAVGAGMAAREPGEAALEEAMLRRVLDGCPANIAMARIGSGELIYRTPAWRALFGPTRFAREHYADPAERADLLARLLPTGVLDDYAMRCRRADGTVFPALASVRVVDYRGEEVVVTAVTDVTETVAQRAAADQATERLRDAIDSLDEGFAIYDAEGRLAMFNRRYLALNQHIVEMLRPGVNYEEVLAAALASGTLGPDEYDQVRALASPDPDGDTRPRRFEFRHTDGTWYSIARSATSEGGFVITRRDITERKRREAEERELDEVMRRALDACPVDLVMCRIADGQVLFQSARSIEQYGHHVDGLGYWVDITDRERFMAEIIRAGRVDGMEVDFLRSDGTTLRVALSGRRSTFRGEPVVVSHAFDLSERIAMEAELARQRETLHQSEKLSALGELLAGVAHELNNPLSVVVGHALMLEEEATDPEQRARIAKIGTAAERCVRIVRTFLAMARQRPARMERVTLTEVLETAFDITAHSLRAAGVEVTTQLEPDLAPVSADSDQLVQVFTNILLNAENALRGQPGERVIGMSARCDHRAGEIVVKIKDNGPGIPEAIRSRIFEPFFTTKAVNEGTGIGLAFCHRIIEDHAGRIYVRSQPGRGTSFFVRLPLAGDADPGCAGRDADAARSNRIAEGTP